LTDEIFTIGPQHRVPVGRVHLAQAAVARDAGIVDQHVEPPHFGQQLLHHPFAVAIVGDVDLVGGEAVALVALGGQPGFRRRIARRVSCRHLEAFVMQAPADRRAQSAHPAGYQGYFFVMHGRVLSSIPPRGLRGMKHRV
jgi:hypothetical protein